MCWWLSTHKFSLREVIRNCEYGLSCLKSFIEWLAHKNWSIFISWVGSWGHLIDFLRDRLWEISMHGCLRLLMLLHYGIVFFIRNKRIHFWNSRALLWWSGGVLPLKSLLSTGRLIRLQRHMDIYFDSLYTVLRLIETTSRYWWGFLVFGPRPLLHMLGLITPLFFDLIELPSGHLSNINVTWKIDSLMLGLFSFRHDRLK